MESGLSSLTGQTYAKLIVIRDPYVGEHSHEQRAQLRCLPLLIEHGYDRIIHTDLWDNDFKPVSYTYFDPEDVDPHEIEFPLVHVVSQEGLTEYGEQHLVRSLLKQRSEDDTYIVVSDTNAPRTPAYTTERSFVDEFTPNKGIDYESRVTSYIRDNLDSALPVSTNRGSKNLYYHQISDCHNAVGAPASTLPELFDYENAPPNSPAWDPLYYFVEHDLQEILDRYTERIREALRSWTERGDVQKIANNMDSMLTQCQFRTDRLDERRQQNAELYADA
ncbi:hypothetical protein ACFQMA_18555 [Halosimplex aquaticum]|uniref:Uncharacterized protein n=1 Tax=Halosimplex aquaticum TaxID=3026162 RepID=A0ABD5Y7I2_9EURY|nr:hypothetical protein [Halosimplex aquaticum]